MPEPPSSHSAEDVVKIEVRWHDPPERATPPCPPGTPDPNYNVVAEMLPPVLTLLTMLFGVAEVAVEEVSMLLAGFTSHVRLRYGQLPVDVSLSHHATAPEHVLRLQTTRGDWCALHLSDQQPAGTRTPHIAGAVEKALLAIARAQVDTLRPHLLDGGVPELPVEGLMALREHLAAPLLDAGLLHSPKDEAALNHWSRRGWRVIQQFASHPFTTQREMASLAGLDRDALAKLNAALQRSAMAQELMISQGPAMKYWENTILPLIEAGVVGAARRREPRHPFRVGLYAGVSCMFYCSFCGRNHDAKYAGGDVPPGNAIFESIFRDAPADPYTFYLSGGLEPLTNPGIGRVTAYGAEHGFKLSMYTNGYMLTPQLLARQAGLWDLDTLRISIYGVNHESAASVTGNPKAFAQVVDNARAFLRARNDRNSRLKFGFNFVVLPGRVEEVLELLELIASINRSAAGRQVDFLTLREDYSVPAERGLSRAERARLAEVFDRVRARTAQADLAGLAVDVGYAMHPLSEGGAPAPLEMVNARDMRPRGYPQISVVVDLLGDVYLYREAGFLNRPGADRYIIGRVTQEKSLRTVVAEFLDSGKTIEPREGDTGFFDIFDHVVTHLLNQADDDEAFGVPFSQGPIRDRRDHLVPAHSTLAHPTLAHQTMPRQPA